MNPALKPWLQQQADAICHETLAAAPSTLLYEDDILSFLDALLSAIDLSVADQLYTIQRWAAGAIGSDALTANDWLLVIRLIKERIFHHLKGSLSATIILEEWPNIDHLFTYAIVEATKIASNTDNAVLLEHMVDLREQIEELDRNKSRFIQVAAHELKTPLTLLEGYANMMRDVVPDDNLLMQMYLGGFDGGTERLREIIGDMIDVSLIDSGRIEITLQPVYLEKVVQRVAQTLQRAFLDRKVELIIEPFPIQRPVYGDPERLMQAIAKVIGNGLKYTPDGGQVTISAAPIRLHEKGDDFHGYVDIRVQDTGIGIDAEQLEKIFETFASIGSVSLHSSGKTKFKGGGPGLGLPIARGIVEAHGGALWAESPGFDERRCPGSTFHIELPLRNRPTAA